MTHAISCPCMRTLSVASTACVSPASARRVDRVDLGVRERAPQDRHVEHVRELDVLDVVATADDEARVLLALDALAQPAAAALGLDGGHEVSFSLFAAHCTDLTMFWYPVQRQMFPESAQRISSSVGSGFSSSSTELTSIIPGVQNPH